MALDEMTLLARCNGLHTQTFRPVHMAAGKFEAVDEQILSHTHAHEHTEECSHEHHGAHLGVTHNPNTAYITRFDEDLLRTAVQVASRR